ARVLRWGTEPEPQDEPQRHRDGALEYDLHQRRADAVRRAVVGGPHARAAGGARGLAGSAVAAGERARGASQFAFHRARFAVSVDRAPLGGSARRAPFRVDLPVTAL